MNFVGMARQMTRTSGSRIISLFGLFLGISLAACSTPTGPAISATGSRVIITNPAGGGPQVLRWGPPDTPPQDSYAG